MNDWDADPALGCGLMMLVGFVVVIIAAAYIVAWTWSVLG